MGLFGVKRSGDCKDAFHQFSVLSPSDFSVSHNLVLPFDEDESVYGGSCVDVVYFYSEWGKTVIYNLQNNQVMIDVVPPPELLAPNYDARAGKRGRSGKMISCGVSYDANSGDYKVIRIYHQEAVYDCYFDLYSVLSRSSKELTGPSRKCFPWMWSTSIYVGEAGSGSSGSCYWLSRLCYNDKDDDITHHPLCDHVLSFDFATESFDQFALPATGKGFNPLFELVRCRGSLGVLAYWTPYDEFGVDGCQCSPGVDCRCFPNLTVQLFVQNGKGTSWDLLYDVSVADGYEPIGLKDDRVLFIAAKRPRGGRFQLMVYYLASKTLKKLDIWTGDPQMCGIYYGDKKKKKNKNKNKKNKGKGER